MAWLASAQSFHFRLFIMPQSDKGWKSSVLLGFLFCLAADPGCHLVPHLDLLARTSVHGLSLWSGFPQSMVAEFQEWTSQEHHEKAVVSFMTCSGMSSSHFVLMSPWESRKAKKHSVSWWEESQRQDVNEGFWILMKGSQKIGSATITNKLGMSLLNKWWRIMKCNLDNFLRVCSGKQQVNFNSD